MIATCLGIYDFFFQFFFSFLFIVNLGSPSVREVVSCLGLSGQKGEVHNREEGEIGTKM